MVYQAHTSRYRWLAERSRDAGPQRRAYTVLVPVERLKLTGIEECVSFDRPMGFTWEMRDEARSRSPEQIAAQRVDYNCEAEKARGVTMLFS